jgi:hypothetical protein
MARPFSGEPQAIQIAIRVSPELKEILTRLASADRRNLSDFLRVTVLKQLETQGVENLPAK